MVVINGPAIIAGSNPIFLAIIGKIPPTSFAEITVTTVVKEITQAIINATFSMYISLNRFIRERNIPTIILILNSFHSTLYQSRIDSSQ